MSTRGATLPLDQGLTRVSRKERFSEIHPPDGRPNILVVDDENGPRQALRVLLNESYRIHLAPDVDEALECWRSEAIDVIITDIRMPKQSGVDLLRVVKKDDPDIQVIVMTGYGHLESAMKAVKYDAFAYLEKPFDNQKMLDLVAEALAKGRRERERRSLERLALEANRFETFGRVVSGMIHDLGTPLSIIGSHLDLLLEATPSGDLTDRLDIMNTQVRHSSEIVRKAMAFLRDETRQRIKVDVNDIIKECVEVAGPVLRRDVVTLTLDLAPDLPRCALDLVLMRQAIINIIVNACTAMKKQESPRTLTIRTCEKNKAVHVAIEDSGPGIPENLRERVFDTFYTTRGSHGNGVGLTVVKYVMRQHEGTVSLETGTQGGARFILAFPSID